MVRLHRVTFTALHKHLGLTHELVQSHQSQQRKRSMVFPTSASATRRATLANIHGGTEDNACPPDLLESDISDTQKLVSDSARKLSKTDGGNPPIFRRQHSQSTIRSMELNSPTENLEVLQQATEAFRIILGLEDHSLLTNVVHIKDVLAGEIVVKEESHQEESGLIYIQEGLLSLTQKENDKDVLIMHAHAGEFFGSLAVLTGEASLFTLKAKKPTRVAIMPASSFYTIMSLKPKVVLHVAHIVVNRLSPFVRQIDFAMDWDFVESGRALYRQGEESDSTFIVLSGRLRSVITQDNSGKKQLVCEYGRGDLVGIVETLTCTPRSTTVMAVRDTEVAKLPEGLLNVIKLKYPMVVSRLINLLGRRILGSWQQNSLVSNSTTIETKPSQANFSTVAVLAVSDDVPLSAFTFELTHSLSNIGPSLRLTSDYMRSTLGNSVLDSSNEYKLNAWLGQQEDKHRIVVYQCDSSMTIWTQRCIRQADCILIVGLGAGEPTVGKVEKQLEHVAVRSRRELVLLHKDDGSTPKNTAVWLNLRSWCSTHHHLQCPNRVFTKKAKLPAYFEKLENSEPNIHSDFSRLARWLTGTSIGLVLGGGGARGAAHVGMIKAITEAGIPIDMIGGVSIGSLMSGLWASERNLTPVTQKARAWSHKMTQLWRQIWDLTYPVTSMFSGAGFNATLKDTFDEIQIEDLWLPYFAVTTDITSSCMRVHSHGSLWRYVRGSMSLSGYMPPLCDPSDGHLLLDGGYTNNLPGTLWRYVRASMSIAGLFPPLCDPTDGHLLVDGCYVDNVPADVMRNHGARYILAVDVGSQDDTDLTNYGDSLSGWWLLWQRYTSHFRSATIKVPNLPEIQSRLAYVSCVRQLEEVRSSDYCHYIRPAIDKYKTMQFGSFDEIRDVGYSHGKTYFDGMMRGGSILPLFGLMNATEPERRSPDRLNYKNNPTGTYKFTDLADIVCQIRSSTGPYSASDDDYSDEETENEC